MRFDPTRGRELITDFLGETAEATFSNDNRWVWIFPRAAGTPIHIQINDDRCDVFAGFTFRTSMLAGEDSSEWMIIDCIEAIINGHAVEYFNFEDSPLAIDERSLGICGNSFEGRGISISSGEDIAVKKYPIPAWADRPAPR